MGDIAGIAVRCGEDVLPQFVRSHPQYSWKDICSQYTPVALMPFCGGGVKEQLREARYGVEGRVGYSPFAESMNAAAIEKVRESWLSAAIHHPIAYCERRLMVFQSFLRFGYDVPFRPYYIGTPPSIRFGPGHPPNFLGRQILAGVYYACKLAPILFKPWLWLFWGMFFCAIIPTYRGSPQVRIGALLLSISAVCYLAPYLIIAPESDFRYAYWAVWAVTMAAAMLLLDLIHRRSLGCNKRVCLVGVVVFAGLLWTDLFLAHSV